MRRKEYDSIDGRTADSNVVDEQARDLKPPLREGEKDMITDPRTCNRTP